MSLEMMRILTASRSYHIERVRHELVGGHGGEGSSGSRRRCKDFPSIPEENKVESFQNAPKFGSNDV